MIDDTTRTAMLNINEDNATILRIYECMCNEAQIYMKHSITSTKSEVNKGHINAFSERSMKVSRNNFHTILRAVLNIFTQYLLLC